VIGRCVLSIYPNVKEEPEINLHSAAEVRSEESWVFRTIKNEPKVIRILEGLPDSQTSLESS
jgi:hypothetical protein